MPTINVSNLSQLHNALASSRGGETILLSGGNYGDLYLSPKSGAHLSYASNVTIKSADASRPAVFDSVSAQGSRNMTFEGLKFDYEYQLGEATSLRAVALTNVTNVTIRNCTFAGDVAYGTNSAADGYGTGYGLSVRGSQGVLVENNEVYNFLRGMTFYEVNGLTVRNNEIQSMRSDGMNFSEVQNVLIEDNYLHDFRQSPTSADHADMIQFHTNGTDRPSSNITIRDNVLDIGDGSWTQSIFMRNEEVDSGRQSFAAMAYQNVRIENNTITNAQAHGITVGETKGLVIANNSVLHADGGQDDGRDSGVEIPRILVAPTSTGVTIAQNITSHLVNWNGQAGWTVRDNAFVQDQDATKDNHYSKVFKAASLTDDGPHVFQAITGGLVDKLNAGSLITQGLGGAVAKPVTPTAPVVTPDTGTDTSSGSAYDLLSLTGSRFTGWDGTKAIDLGAAPSMTSDGLQLSGRGVTARVEREHVDDVVGSDDMMIAFKLDADAKGAAGELFRMHGSFLASVTSMGELNFRIQRDGDTTVSLTTKGVALNATAEKDRSIVVNLENGKLQIWVDDKLAAQTDFDGVVGGKGFGSHDMVFGNPFDRVNFNGDISAFEITMNGQGPAASSQIASASSAQEQDLDYAVEFLPEDDARFDLVTSYQDADLAA